MKTIAITLLAALILGGCAGTDVTPNKAANMSTKKLCEEYGLSYRMYGNHPENIKAELLRRKAFSAIEWKYIDNQLVTPGMHLNAVICAFGTYDRVHAYSYSEDQYVFKYKGVVPFYVYVDNGIVSGYNN